MMKYIKTLSAKKKEIQLFQKSISFLLVLCLLSSCADKRDNLKIDDSVFTKPSTVVITQIYGLERPAYYTDPGNSGLIGAFLADIIQNDDAAQEVREINSSSIVEKYYYNAFKKGFENKNFNVRISETSFKKRKLIGKNRDAKKAPWDFKFLKTLHNAQYALVLSPQYFGVHAYTGLWVDPRAETRLNLYLVNLDDNTLVGCYNAYITSPVSNWKTPPDYDTLTTAVKNSLIMALRNALAFFFEES
tara:strand:- start:12465 stop:13202 length:738 start_codon:yes stop_codon:yes gene_type:complete